LTHNNKENKKKIKKTLVIQI